LGHIKPYIADKRLKSLWKVASMTTWRRKTQKNQKNDAYQRIDLIKITAKLIDNITHAVQISNKDFSKILR